MKSQKQSTATHSSLPSNENPPSENSNQFGYKSELFIPKWSVPARIIVFIFGVVGLVMSSRTRGYVRRTLSMFGISSLIRATTNLHVTDLIGWIANPTIELNRSLEVKAVIEDVYEFLSNFENYSKFMSYVKKVEVNEKGGLHWTIQGPANLQFHWDTQLGTMVKNQTISWKSSINSLIRNSGEIQLIDIPNKGTKVQIRLTYAPPIGALGYAAASFLGFDPKEKIDQDLAHLKQLIEASFEYNQELIHYHRA